VLFSSHKGSEVWTTTGFCDWNNGPRCVQHHELTSEHREAEIVQIQWKRGAQIDKMMAKSQSHVVDENRRVVECATDCIRFLANVI